MEGTGLVGVVQENKAYGAGENVTQAFAVRFHAWGCGI